MTQIGVLLDVTRERRRQDEKWGDQSSTCDGTGPGFRPFFEVLRGEGNDGRHLSAELLAERFTEQTDRSMRLAGGASMAEILLEEVFEALAENEADQLRKELIQVAAVAVAWCEYLDRRGSL